MSAHHDRGDREPPQHPRRGRRWGRSASSARVRRAAGVTSGGITTSQARWLAFDRASMRKGYGTQACPAA